MMLSRKVTLVNTENSIKAAVVIDEWKFPIFKEIFDKQGLSFAKTRFNKDTLVLTVIGISEQELLPIVKMANHKAAMKRNKHLH